MIRYGVIWPSGQHTVVYADEFSTAWDGARFWANFDRYGDWWRHEVAHIAPGYLAVVPLVEET